MIVKNETIKNNKKILVVDDDEGIVDAIALILEDEGYLVETTSKGEESIDKTKNLHPDILILDVLLSGTDGRIICRELKNDIQTKAIPVIMISAHPNIKESVTQSGADAFLPKPFDAKTLLDTIATLLE